MKLTNTSKQSVGVDHRGEHVTILPGKSIDIDSEEDWNNHLFVKAGWLVLEESDESSVDDDEDDTEEDTETETETEDEEHAETNTAVNSDDVEVSATGTDDSSSPDVGNETASKGEYVIHHKSKGWYDVIAPDGSVVNETALREADAQDLANRMNDGNNG